MKKLNLKSVIGILTAVVAGLTAFIGNVQDQKKEERILEMANRITNLEKQIKGN